MVWISAQQWISNKQHGILAVTHNVENKLNNTRQERPTSSSSSCSRVSKQMIPLESIETHITFHRIDSVDIGNPGLDNPRVFPRRKTNKGRLPTIAASGSEEQKEKLFKPWNLPVRQPDERARRIMLREALRVALTVIMKNPCTPLITRSGSKPNAARLAWSWLEYWPRSSWFGGIRNLPRGIVVRMNKRYVDGINLAVQATPPGTRCKNGQTYAILRRRHNGSRTNLRSCVIFI